MNRPVHRNPNGKGFHRRRLLLESLEMRLSPALLIPGADAAAFSDFQGVQMGPTLNSDPAHAVAATAVGPIVNWLPQPFQESADAEATTPGPVLGRSSSGGARSIQMPNATDDCSIATAGQLTILPRQPSKPSATVSCSAAKATSNWVVIGVPGQMVDVDVQIQIAGYLETLVFASSPVSSSVVASLLLSPDRSPAATLFDATATLTNGVLVQHTGGWAFSQVVGHQTRYETNHTSTVTFTIAAGEQFSLQAALNTLARADGPYELFGYSDFSTSGLTYAVSTSDPGASVAPVGSGGTVSGILWHDVNANEVEDLSEPRLSGFRFFLDANQNGVFDAATERDGLTDANGVYSIGNVSAGTYDVTLEVPPGWEQTSPLDTSGNPIVDSVPVQDGVLSTARPYGAREIPGAWSELSGRT